MHVLLGVGVADLDVAGRGARGRDFRRGRHPVNPVLAHPAAAGEDQVAGPGRLFGPGLPPDLSGQKPGRGHEHQALAQVGRIKVEDAAHRGHPALVAAVFDAFDDAVQQPPGVQPGF